MAPISGARVRLVRVVMSGGAETASAGSERAPEKLDDFLGKLVAGLGGLTDQPITRQLAPALIEELRLDFGKLGGSHLRRHGQAFGDVDGQAAGFGADEGTDPVGFQLGHHLTNPIGIRKREWFGVGWGEGGDFGCRKPGRLHEVLPLGPAG